MKFPSFILWVMFSAGLIGGKISPNWTPVIVLVPAIFFQFMLGDWLDAKKRQAKDHEKV